MFRKPPAWIVLAGLIVMLVLVFGVCSLLWPHIKAARMKATEAAIYEWLEFGRGTKASIAEAQWYILRERLGSDYLDLPPETRAIPFTLLSDKYIAEGDCVRSHTAYLEKLKIEGGPPGDFEVFVGAAANDTDWLKGVGLGSSNESQRAFMDAAVFYSVGDWKGVVSVRTGGVEDALEARQMYRPSGLWLHFIKAKAYENLGDTAKAAEEADTVISGLDRMGTGLTGCLYVTWSCLEIYAKAKKNEQARLILPHMKDWLTHMDVSWDSVRYKVSQLDQSIGP